MKQLLCKQRTCFLTKKNKEKFLKNSNRSRRGFKEALVEILENPKVKWGMRGQDEDEDEDEDSEGDEDDSGESETEKKSEFEDSDKEGKRNKSEKKEKSFKGKKQSVSEKKEEMSKAGRTKRSQSNSKKQAKSESPEKESSFEETPDEESSDNDKEEDEYKPVPKKQKLTEKAKKRRKSSKAVSDSSSSSSSGNDDEPEVKTEKPGKQRKMSGSENKGATEFSKAEPKKAKLDNLSFNADEVVKIKKEEKSKSKDDTERKKQEKLQKIAEKKAMLKEKKKKEKLEQKKAEKAKMLEKEKEREKQEYEKVEKEKSRYRQEREREKATERAEKEKQKEKERKERERRKSTPPTVEEILDKMNYNLVMSLTVEAPDVPKCLKIITQISEMEINPDIIKKNPEIVQTIKRIRNYKQNPKVREKASQLYTQFKSLFSIAGADSSVKPPPRAASTNETTLLGTTTLDNSERTEPLAAAAVEDSVETKQLPHDTPTENGSDWHGPSVEVNLGIETEETRSKFLIKEELQENDSSVGNLTPEPMEVQNAADPTENLSPCDMDISSPD